MPKKLSEFNPRCSADHTGKIRAYLRSLGAQYVDQLELCRATGVSFSRLAPYRERFAAHLVPTRSASGKPTFLWAGTPKLAKQMRAIARGESNG